ncbi:hypothetical protein [Leuconostoc mesenteroides]|jgi:hypothetical protein|uniref:hypothetical protein n=1 Tax=Leuconostoc mesenteroides TaxID=1245 RepID=UPI000AA75151|nr:hypothetical protein [Leuconostoc mesenteroides]
MTEKEKVQAIVDKYHKSYGEFQKQATRKEFKEVLMYVANEANMKQRRTAGLEN